MKKVCILGATGSIGRQTLEVCKKNNYTVTAVAANSNYKDLINICEEYKPKFAALYDKESADAFNLSYSNIKAFHGTEGITRIIEESNADIVLNAIVGNAGIIPTLSALDNVPVLALANKETLVSAGEIIIKRAKSKKCTLLPVDSEHSAIFQCLMGNKSSQVKRLILTASGGPFKGYTREMLEKVQPEEALKHPNWNMGSKITIDSATLMNKGLEVIEAKWLFDIEYNKIDVVIHPQSIIHSMVQYKDNSYMAQIGFPDMRIPIQFALNYPERKENDFNTLDFSQIIDLQMYPPDKKVFKALDLAYTAGREGGTMPCVMNAANEEAVDMFLQKRISFNKISEIIEIVMNKHNNKTVYDIDTVIDSDRWARSIVRGMEV